MNSLVNPLVAEDQEKVYNWFGMWLTTATQRCLNWLESKTGTAVQEVAATRDVFHGRLDSLFHELTRLYSQGDTALITSVLGEIGNNSFDHNLGQWKDVPGCWFEYEIKSQIGTFWIADRGQGIYSSLKRVTNVRDDNTALELAFHKQISGRAPERRGNGLKYVRAVIHGNSMRGLLCCTGNGSIHFGGLRMAVQKNAETSLGLQGTLTIIRWEFDAHRT